MMPLFADDVWKLRWYQKIKFQPVNDATDKWQHQLSACVNAEAGHFEHHLDLYTWYCEVQNSTLGTARYGIHF